MRPSLSVVGTEEMEEEAHIPRKKCRAPRLSFSSPMLPPLAYIGLINSRGFVKTYVPIHADVIYIGERHPALIRIHHRDVHHLHLRIDWSDHTGETKPFLTALGPGCLVEQKELQPGDKYELQSGTHFFLAGYHMVFSKTRVATTIRSKNSLPSHNAAPIPSESSNVGQKTTISAPSTPAPFPTSSTPLEPSTSTRNASRNDQSTERDILNASTRSELSLAQYDPDGSQNLDSPMDSILEPTPKAQLAQRPLMETVTEEQNQDLEPDPLLRLPTTQSPPATPITIPSTVVDSLSKDEPIMEERKDETPISVQEEPAELVMPLQQNSTQNSLQYDSNSVDMDMDPPKDECEMTSTVETVGRGTETERLTKVTTEWLNKQEKERISEQEIDLEPIQEASPAPSVEPSPRSPPDKKWKFYAPTSSRRASKPISVTAPPPRRRKSKLLAAALVSAPPEPQPAKMDEISKEPTLLDQAFDFSNYGNDDDEKTPSPVESPKKPPPAKAIRRTSDPDFSDDDTGGKRRSSQRLAEEEGVYVLTRTAVPEKRPKPDTLVGAAVKNKRRRASTECDTEEAHNGQDTGKSNPKKRVAPQHPSQSTNGALSPKKPYLPPQHETKKRMKNVGSPARRRGPKVSSSEFEFKLSHLSTPPLPVPKSTNYEESRNHSFGEDPLCFPPSSPSPPSTV